MKQCNDMFPLDTEEERGSGVARWSLVMLLLAAVAIVWMTL
jgi:hypothetical protein